MAEDVGAFSGVTWHPTATAAISNERRVVAIFDMRSNTRVKPRREAASA